MPNNLTQEQKDKLNYDGELTLEALAVLDKYSKACCNTALASRWLHKDYNQVRRILKQPYVRELFKLKLLEAGVTPEKIADTITKGLDATNGVYNQGAHIADEPNWNARQKFAQLSAEIFEVLKYQVKQDVHINQTISDERKIILIDLSKRLTVPVDKPVDSVSQDNT